MINLYSVLAVVAVAILAITEVLLSIQKSQMKMQFLNELDQRNKPIDSRKKAENDSGEKVSK